MIDSWSLYNFVGIWATTMQSFSNFTRQTAATLDERKQAPLISVLEQVAFQWFHLKADKLLAYKNLEHVKRIYLKGIL